MRRYYTFSGKYPYPLRVLPLPWGELLIAILLLCLCSCRTKKVVTDEAVKEHVRSEVSVLNEVAKVDTSMTTTIEEVEELKVVEEEIRTVKYDTEGRVTEETTTRRKMDTQKNEHGMEVNSRMISWEEKTEQDIDVEAEKERHTDSTEQTEPNTFFVTSGKWFGIIIGIAVLIAILRVINKFRER